MEDYGTSKAPRQWGRSVSGLSHLTSGSLLPCRNTPLIRQADAEERPIGNKHGATLSTTLPSTHTRKMIILLHAISVRSPIYMID